LSVRTYLLRRLALMVFVLIGVTIVTFLLVRVVPSDPAAVYAGPRARPEQIEEARRILGLDRPLYVQYGIYVADLVQGDWGTSLRTRRPVLDDMLNFLPYSLQLVFLALLVSIVVGVSLGALTAHRKGSWIDNGTRVLAIGGVSMPSFVLAVLLQILFFRILGLLPVSGELDIAVSQAHPVTQITGMTAVDAFVTANFVAFVDAMEHLVLPVLTLAAFSAGVITRMTRSAMLAQERHGAGADDHRPRIRLPARRHVLRGAHLRPPRAGDVRDDLDAEPRLPGDHGYHRAPGSRLRLHQPRDRPGHREARPTRRAELGAVSGRICRERVAEAAG
jgi:ABC-type dipeptide/oligopeptide/nickel transport system permease component